MLVIDGQFDVEDERVEGAKLTQLQALATDYVRGKLAISVR